MAYDPDYYQRHKEQFKASRKRYNEKHREEIKKRMAERYQKNKKKMDAKSREWRKKNREKFNEIHRIYVAKHKDHLNECRRENKARKRAEKILFRQAHPELYHETKGGHWVKNTPPLTPEQIALRKKRAYAWWKEYMKDPAKWEKHKAHSREYMRRKAEAKREAKRQQEEAIRLLSESQQTSVT